MFSEIGILQYRIIGSGAFADRLLEKYYYLVRFRYGSVHD